MEWLWGTALLPLLVCGGMCVGGMILAALGLRRANAAGGCHDARRDQSATDSEGERV
jgi:hypothetical protein